MLYNDDKRYKMYYSNGMSCKIFHIPFDLFLLFGFGPGFVEDFVGSHVTGANDWLFLSKFCGGNGVTWPL